MSEPMFRPFGQRRTGIGGTDARRIAAGEWLDLWREKMGEIEPPNLEHIFRVQLGLATEPLHARWFFRQTKLKLVDPGDEPITTAHAPEPFMFATLDRWVVDRFCPLEMKHTHGGNSLHACAEYYMAQIQHQAMVTGADKVILSIIKGNDEPEHVVVSRDEAYCTRLLEQEREFWGYVEREERPPALDLSDPDLPVLAHVVPIDGRKPYDLGTNNAWVDKAADYVRLKPHADAFKAVDKELRELIPADASIVTGGGLQFKRDARGAYRCTILEEENA